MKHKIIVADDSLTIQKVIKITLAKEDFELIECLEDHKLHDLCKEVKPTLVLLDFNLSENKTGYDLCQEIKNSDVDKILMLYGTFDTVDENLLDHCGANGHIVKPFEGTKFVNLCRQLIDDASSYDENDDDVVQFADEEDDSDIPENEIDLDDQWVMNQPEGKKFEEDKTDEHDMSHFLEPQSEENSLKSEASEWGIDIPSIINDSKESKSVELPPIIEDSSDHKKEIELELEEEVMPDELELEYPNVEEIRNSVQAEPTPKAKLIPLDDLESDNEPLELSLDDTLGTKTDDEVRALEEQIANETEEDLWAVDDEESNDYDIDNEEVSEEIPEPVSIKAEPVKEPGQKEAAPTISREEILEALEKQIEEIVSARVEAIIEKVAWEVIPDLAENLISKELKNLAKNLDD